MANEQVAARYAQAAFAIALERNAIPAWRSGLDDVATVLGSSAAAPVLADARVPLEQRLRVVERTLDVDPLVLNLAKLLVSKGRSTVAAQVAEAFGRLADDHEGVANAEIVSAVELTDDQVAAIEARLATGLGKTIRSTRRVDPDLVGGIIIRVGDRLFDASVRSRLTRLRRQLEGVR